ncbi:hypothetical protein CCHR01_16995 [Colletotrichum chrysophilum]|uniref:PiggyBac transposable element-derived protein domain-containing protein n=1 Tax=Colletotrichum chrysophilum TaxID=1836956 RepID=A0AAD9A2S7_9PEZI|nr:hypothetical protein CCHR01_16995 [Colletotrichum chrysophilum]
MDSDDSDASTGSVKSCIVALLPEDLSAACTDQCAPERCDNATVRPREPPEVEPGVPGHFLPLDVPRRAPEIRGLPDRPIDLLFRYIPRDLVGRWAEWTNGAESSKFGPAQQHSRNSKWRPTSTEEIYLFLGILIYMGLHSESQIDRYWSIDQKKEDPIHPFTRFISRDRFLLLLRRIRIFDPAQAAEPEPPAARRLGQSREYLMPKVYRQVNEWSAHIQQTGDHFYRPGSDLTVHEAMVRFTGRSLETTTVPTKPTPTGYKVWILAQSGYCLRWMWHVHGAGPYGLVPQARPAPGDEATKRAALTPTQRVVTSLLSLLPLAVYHVFLDNLFASVKLFRALRRQNIGATGTCRKDGGIDAELVAEKADEGKGIPWGAVHAIPTADGEVNQFTWKDNALVLFLTTVYRETSEVIRSRRRPAGDTAAKRAARQVFGPDVRKDLAIPSAIDQYNHNMNGVDTSDQMRSYYAYERPIRRGGWQSIAWNFLLEVIVVNSFFLQNWGEPNWRRFESQYRWRKELSAQLIQQFGPLAGARRKSRPFRATDKRRETIPWQHHTRGRRYCSSPCVACSKVSIMRRRAPLGQISGNSLNRRIRRKTSRSGCVECDVALCTTGDCWYNFHTQNI